VSTRRGPGAGEAPFAGAGGSDAPPTAAGSPADLPPDPESYDAPRAVQARARGLAAPYIAGGVDPEPERGRREERRYLRLLVIMIVVIVLSGFVLGYLAEALGFPS
jgi:hypothetical protein